MEIRKRIKDFIVDLATEEVEYEPREKFDLENTQEEFNRNLMKDVNKVMEANERIGSLKENLLRVQEELSGKKLSPLKRLRLELELDLIETKIDRQMMNIEVEEYKERREDLKDRKSAKYDIPLEELKAEYNEICDKRLELENEILYLSKTMVKEEKSDEDEYALPKLESDIKPGEPGYKYSTTPSTYDRLDQKYKELDDLIELQKTKDYAIEDMEVELEEMRNRIDKNTQIAIRYRNPFVMTIEAIGGFFKRVKETFAKMRAERKKNKEPIKVESIDVSDIEKREEEAERAEIKERVIVPVEVKEKRTVEPVIEEYELDELLAEDEPEYTENEVKEDEPDITHEDEISDEEMSDILTTVDMINKKVMMDKLINDVTKGKAEEVVTDEVINEEPAEESTIEEKIAENQVKLNKLVNNATILEPETVEEKITENQEKLNKLANNATVIKSEVENDVEDKPLTDEEKRQAFILEHQERLRKMSDRITAREQEEANKQAEEEIVDNQEANEEIVEQEVSNELIEEQNEINVESMQEGIVEEQEETVVEQPEESQTMTEEERLQALLDIAGRKPEQKTGIDILKENQEVKKVEEALENGDLVEAQRLQKERAEKAEENMTSDELFNVYVQKIRSGELEPNNLSDGYAERIAEKRRQEKEEQNNKFKEDLKYDLPVNENIQQEEPMTGIDRVRQAMEDNKSLEEKYNEYMNSIEDTPERRARVEKFNRDYELRRQAMKKMNERVRKQLFGDGTGSGTGEGASGAAEKVNEGENLNEKSKADITAVIPPPMPQNDKSFDDYEDR